MLKIVGSIMIITSSVMVGMHFKNGLASRVKSLEEFVYLLDFISREIGINLTEIPDIFLDFKGRSISNLNHFIRALNDKIASDDESFTFKWINSIDEYKDDLGLMDEDIRVLNQLGSVFGRYTATEQLKSIKYAKKSLEYNLKTSKAELMQKGNVYKVTSVCIGIILVLCFV